MTQDFEQFHDVKGDMHGKNGTELTYCGARKYTLLNPPSYLTLTGTVITLQTEKDSDITSVFSSSLKVELVDYPPISKIFTFSVDVKPCAIVKFTSSATYPATLSFLSFEKNSNNLYDHLFGYLHSEWTQQPLCEYSLFSSATYTNAKSASKTPLSIIDI